MGSESAHYFVITVVPKIHPVTNDLLKASTILELVHVATLVHDDLIDGAPYRREKKSLHSFAGEHSAVLLGDALFSYALELASEFPSNRICQIVSRATRLTCSGEISQTNSRGNFDITVKQYYDFIQGKTGELFKASCQTGAFIAEHTENDIDLVGEFGMRLGICYQVYDDLHDAFGSPSESNKPVGLDFISGKLTLPILLLLANLKDTERIEVVKLLNDRDHSLSKPIISKLLEEKSILSLCKNEFDKQFSKLNLILCGISDKTLADNLARFLSLFTAKLTKLDNLKVSNFLALLRSKHNRLFLCNLLSEQRMILLS